MKIYLDHIGLNPGIQGLFHIKNQAEQSTT